MLQAIKRDWPALLADGLGVLAIGGLTLGQLVVVIWLTTGV